MSAQSYYLEHDNGQLFVQVTLNGTLLHIRRGHIGKPCLVFEISSPKTDVLQKNFGNLKAYFQEHAYQEKQTIQEIIDGSKAVLLRSQQIKSHAEYSKLMQIEWMDDFEDKPVFAYHFANGLSYHDDLDISLFCDSFRFQGVIIEGDVQVDGVFSDLGISAPNAILILGNVNSRSFYKEFSYIVIDGHLTVEQTVFGEFNDGSLKITGDVDGEAWISNDHNMYAEGEYRLFNQDFFNEGIANWLNPTLIDDEEQLDVDKIREFIYAGKPVVRTGATYSPEPDQPVEPTPPIIQEEPIAEIPLFDPKLIGQLNVLAEADDNMGMTMCLVNWQTRDDGWVQLVHSRLRAPSCSDEEKELLKKVLADYQSK